MLTNTQYYYMFICEVNELKRKMNSERNHFAELKFS